MEWKEVHTEKDIEFLLRQAGNFHDSCIVSLSYRSGAGVDDELRMGMGSAQQHTLHLVLQRQVQPITIELCFSGVRRFFVQGWLENYFCDLSGCSLAYHHDLTDKEDERLIVWTDSPGCNSQAFFEHPSLDLPAISFVLAENLKWRFLDL